MTAFHVLLIAFIVSVGAKLPAPADNAEARSSVSEAFVESSVVNDNICNNKSPMQHDGLRRVSKRQTARDNRREFKDRPRPDQRSLLIVFDATGSMHDDLEQLRAGAKEIVNELSSREDNPIYNYVLVVYRDPVVEPAFDTKNPDELLSELKKIQTTGGGDCPEYVVSGLRIALQFALPNSLAYVFSDATAKDLGYQNAVLSLIQKKQVSVNFLLTGDCDDPTGPGYQFYLKLSRASNGQVYDMNKSNVKDVLLAIRHAVNYNYASLKSVDTESAGTTNTKLNIDKSISELSVSLSGRNPKLTIKDPRNETIRTGDELTLKNLKLVKIKDPVDGLWNVEAAADSSHSIRLGAISEMKFEFGFSIDEPTKKSETSYQPLDARENILAIFVSDPSLIETLSDVTIILVPSNEHESSLQFKIPLKKLQDDIYVTKAFVVPRQMFKIQLNGVDVNGNVIERLVSTGLQSSQGGAPEIAIEVSQFEVNEFDELSLKCIVKSHTPVNISWVFEGRHLSFIASNQNNELEFTVHRATVSNAGLYICDAINKYGGERDNVTIKVLSAPKVHVVPEKLTLREGEEAIFQCVVEGDAGRKIAYNWLGPDGNLIENANSAYYRMHASPAHHEKAVTCEVDVDEIVISSRSSLTVQYAPRFVKEVALELTVKHGTDETLSCEANANPEGSVEWFFTSQNDLERRNLLNNERSLLVRRMNENLQGIYECEVMNNRGRIKRSFLVVDVPKGPPKIANDKDVIIVNETDSIDLTCETSDSLPITNFSWSNDNSNHYERIVIKDEMSDNFKYVLRISDVDESDSGSFECFLENSVGQDRTTLELLVQTPPKVDSIMMKTNEAGKEIDREVTVLENEDLIFECIVDGFPTPQVVWFKDQDEVKTSDNDTVLIIESVVEKTAGRYQCLASNILGKVSKSFQVKVEFPPKRSGLENQVVKVVEGKKVSLNCDMTANPAPTISWSVNGRFLKNDDRLKLSDNNKTLSLLPLITDSGVYACSANNQHGYTQTNFTFVVLGVPQIIIPSDEQRKKKVGEEIELSCDATGFPQPHISWSKDKTWIGNGTSLTLKNLKLDDWGAYVCAAKNDVGSTEKVFFVSVVEPPSIISKFENFSVSSMDTRTVKCEVAGSPEPDVFWSFNEEKVRDGPELPLNSSMTSGLYSCTAENSAGKSTRSFSFTAINKPTIIEDHNELKKEIKVREGDGLELLCPFENFNEIAWLYNNSSIDKFPHEQSKNRLKLTKLDRSVGGEWKCIASNIAGTETFSFNVTILASPIIHASWNLNNRISDFLVTESDIDEKILKVGESLELNCTAEGFPKPKVVWRKATDKIAEGETLLVENLQYHHSDIYTCSAENDQGTVKKFFKIDVVSPPQIDDADIPKSHLKAVGESATLQCKMSGNPPPNIFWFKDNILLDDETETHLEIKKLKQDDDGSYKCIGKNTWGRVSMEFHISVMQPAKIIRAEEEQKVARNGNSMTLSCTVQGNPMPIVSWISNGHIISTTSKLNLGKIFKTVDDSVIYFNGFGNSINYLDPFKLKVSKETFYSQLTRIDEKSLKLDLIFKDRSMKAAGNYHCYAYNALGRDDGSVEIKVLEKPHVVDGQSGKLEKQEVLEGLPLLLTCLIAGEPTPKISWYKETLQIHENETVKLLNNNRFLNIAETFSWNSGDYTCKGVNEEGEETVSFLVSVLSPPKFIDFSVVSVMPANRFINDKTKADPKLPGKELVKVLKGDEVVLECFAEGLPSPSLHWLKMNFYDSSKNQVLDEVGNVLLIPSIKENSNYKCYVNNTVGNVQRLFQVLVQFAPEFIDDGKTEHHHSVKLHHGVNLNCRVDANPEANVRWSFNGTYIKPDSKEFFLSDSNQVMRIIDTKKHNQGKFVCIAENEFGRVERVFYVKVDVPIQWSPFGAWSTCSVSCGGGGIQYRTKICLLSNGHPATSEDYKCVGENVETRKCNRLPCPVNGGWGDFSSWSKCPRCINEKIHEIPFLSKRVRKCDSPIPSNGGLECPGDDTEELECQSKYCVMNGGWSEWSTWSACSKSCGPSHRFRRRSCNNPAPKHNGSDCDGENVEFDDCKLPPCIDRLKKSFNGEDDDDLEDWSNESREKYGEAAEFEIKDSNGITRNYQFMNHREVEIAPPIRDIDGNSPKIRVTLDTYRPISEETYNQHVRHQSSNRNTQRPSTSSEDIELESTEIDQPPPRKRNCLQGFSYNNSSDQCEDINECLKQNCANGETCVNTLGSFRCVKKSQRHARN